MKLVNIIEDLGIHREFNRDIKVAKLGITLVKVL